MSSISVWTGFAGRVVLAAVLATALLTMALVAAGAALARRLVAQ